jgi:Winged helix DNA-binding domain
LAPVRTPVGDGWILLSDEQAFRTGARGVASARLLPSGDPYTLLHGADRALMVPDAAHRSALWTPRVWPGAVMVDGQIVGTWRRAQATVSVQAWTRISRTARRAVDAEAEAMPLPGLQGSITVRWE